MRRSLRYYTALRTKANCGTPTRTESLDEVLLFSIASRLFRALGYPLTTS